MKEKRHFNDGSFVECINKEGYQYSEGPRSLLVWVDFAAGWFNRGRVIKLSSLRQWDKVPTGEERSISVTKRQEIVEKLRIYFSGRKVEIEDDLAGQ